MSVTLVKMPHCWNSHAEGHLSPLAAMAAVCSQAVVLLLFIHCLLLLPLGVGVSCLDLVLRCSFW